MSKSASESPTAADPGATLEGFTGAIIGQDLEPLRRWQKTARQNLAAVASRLRPLFAEWQEHGVTLRRWQQALAAPELGRAKGIGENLRQGKLATEQALLCLEGGPVALRSAELFIENRTLEAFRSNYPSGAYAETYCSRAEDAATAFPRQLEAARWHLGEIVKKLGDRPEIGPVAALVEPQPTRPLPTKAKTGGAR